jgi:peptide/nickel transport system permease protein
MIAFFGRSLVQKMITLFFISSQIDPLNPKFTKEVLEQFRQQFHLDKPLHQQYFFFYRDLFTGKSVSWKDGRSVLAKLYDRFLNSLPLFIVGTLITWTLSFPVGIQAAIRRGGVYDRTTTFFAYLLISIPGFFFAYMLIIFVVSTFHVPVIGMKTFGLSGAGVVTRVMDRVWHLVIPSILGATAGIAVLSRYVRNQMMEVETGALQTRPAQRSAAVCDHVRPGFTRTHRWFGDHRIHFRLARNWAPGLRGDSCSGLSPYNYSKFCISDFGAGRDLYLRSALHGGGSED